LNKFSQTKPETLTKKCDESDPMPSLNTKTYLKRFSHEMYSKELDEVPNLYLIRRYLWKYLNEDINLSIEKLRDLILRAGLISEVFEKTKNGYNIHTALENPCFAVKSIVIHTQSQDNKLLKITSLVFCSENKK